MTQVSSKPRTWTKTPHESWSIEQKACSALTVFYGAGTGIQCRLCKLWLLADPDQGASGVYGLLAEHLFEAHEDLHERFVKEHGTKFNHRRG